MTHRSPSLRVHLALVLAAVLVVGCGNGADRPNAASTAQPGATLARDRGCVACHSINGANGLGPTWKGLAGSSVPLADGSVVLADTAYLTRSIREPAAQLVHGYTISMPQLRLTDDEIDDLVAYIESLR